MKLQLFELLFEKYLVKELELAIKRSKFNKVVKRE
jgi:hypothetical protein